MMFAAFLPNGELFAAIIATVKDLLVERRHGSKQIGMKLSVLCERQALQISKVVIGRVAVDVMNDVAFGNCAVVELPNFAMKPPFTVKIIAIVGSIIDNTVKFLVGVIDNNYFQGESLLK